MTPINRAMYPNDWPVISRRIRIDRAGGRCECDGTCGAAAHTLDDGRCTARNGDTLPGGNPVVLTTAHLDHDTARNDDANLRALCQKCHLAYDADHHAETRAATLAARRGAESAEIPLPGLGLEL